MGIYELQVNWEHKLLEDEMCDGGKIVGQSNSDGVDNYDKIFHNSYSETDEDCKTTDIAYNVSEIYTGKDIKHGGTNILLHNVIG